MRVLSFHVYVVLRRMIGYFSQQGLQQQPGPVHQTSAIQVMSSNNALSNPMEVSRKEFSAVYEDNRAVWADMSLEEVRALNKYHLTIFFQEEVILCRYLICFVVRTLFKR